MRWTVSSRLVAFTLVAGLGLGTTAWLGLSAVNECSTNIEHVVDSGLILRNQLQADMLHDGIRGDVMVAILAPDQEAWSRAKQETDGHGADLRELVAKNRELAEQGFGDRELLGRFQDTQREIDEYVAASLAVVEIAGRSREEAIAALPGFEEAFSALEEPMEALADAILVSSEAAKDGALAATATAERNVASAALVALLLLATLGWTTRRSILVPLNAVCASVDALERLDLTHDCKASGVAEMEHMAETLTRATGKLRGTLSTMAAAVEALSLSATDLNSASQRMTREASETAETAEAASGEAARVDGSMQTVSSCVAQMETTVQEIAKTSEDASRVAGGAVESATVARKTISDLVKSSQEVAGIVRVINEIAEQTNLLALNATIEAARAGELGKGFAVVAGEVKELAKQTAEATEDISRRVQASQEGAAKATKSIEEIATVIQQIHAMQSTTSAAIYEQATVTSEIGRSIGEAAGDSASIATRLRGVSKLADDTRDDLATVASSASSVTRTSEDLRGVVQRFRY